MTAIQKTYWQAFLRETGKDIDTPCYECFSFGLNQETADELLALVLKGKKTATTSSLSGLKAEGMEQPKPGDLSIVTDFAGNPQCIIETVSVTTLPFSEMTWDLCKREGEDETLESWQKNHIKFFTEEGEMLGYEFSPDMQVVFEDFRVAYRWPPALPKEGLSL